MQELSPDLIAHINATHLIETKLEAADLLLVFGTRNKPHLRVEKAARLWRSGHFRWAIVSGGLMRGRDASECHLIKSAMVECGIPVDRILEEHRATNTGENVTFSLPIIDRHLGLHTLRNVICLGDVCTGRRYPMTLHRHWPEVEKMLVVVNPYETPVARWHVDPGCSVSQAPCPLPPETMLSTPGGNTSVAISPKRKRHV